MNYVIAFAICLIGTVMASLTRNPDVHWLLVSDGNVALSLFIAWYLDSGKSPLNININVKKVDE